MKKFIILTILSAIVGAANDCERPEHALEIPERYITHGCSVDAAIWNGDTAIDWCTTPEAAARIAESEALGVTHWCNCPVVGRGEYDMPIRKCQ